MAFKKIKEYLSTDDATAGELLIPKLIMPMLVEETDKNLLDRSLAKIVYGPSQIKGSTFNINLEVENSSKVREVAEGTEIPIDIQSYETVEFNPTKYGIAVRITREMMEDSQFSLLQSNIKTAGKRFAENETKLILEALDGANATTSGGENITIANITESMQDLEDNDYTPTDLIIGTEVLNDLRNIDTFAEADKWGDTTSYNRTGFVGRLYGLNVHRFSPNAAPTTDYKKYAYVIDRDEAYGIAIKRDITIENFNMPSFDMEGAVLTNRIDVQLFRSKAVSKITTS